MTIRTLIKKTAMMIRVSMKLEPNPSGICRFAPPSKVECFFGRRAIVAVLKRKFSMVEVNIIYLLEINFLDRL